MIWVRLVAPYTGILLLLFGGDVSGSAEKESSRSHYHISRIYALTEAIKKDFYLKMVNELDFQSGEE